MSRRLGVETMEGRMMLSATTIEFAPVDLQPAHLTLAVGQLNTAGDQTISVTMPNEGGFITASFSNSGSQFDAVFGIPVGVDATLSMSDVYTRGQLLTNFVCDSLQIAGAGSAYDSNGLQPVVIVLSDNGGGLQPVIKGVLVGPVESKPGPDEGGSIPIHPLLAGLRKEEGFAADEKSLSPGGVEKPAESHYAARKAAASSESALSGEWGRGMVFEIAGGEPGASGRPVLEEVSVQTPAGEATSPGDEPLSAIGVQRDGGKTIRREHSSTQSSEEMGDQTGDFEASEQQANESNVRTAAIVDRINSADAIGSLTNDEPRASSSPSQPSATGQDAGAATLGKNEFGVPALASAAAFEQFGVGKMAFVESSAVGNWWGRSLGAMPLLMVLALERIAAHNSRRPTGEAPAKVARKPLRPRAAGGALPG